MVSSKGKIPKNGGETQKVAVVAVDRKQSLWLPPSWSFLALDPHWAYRCLFHFSNSYSPLILSSYRLSHNTNLKTVCVSMSVAWIRKREGEREREWERQQGECQRQWPLSIREVATLSVTRSPSLSNSWSCLVALYWESILEFKGAFKMSEKRTNV